jgi:hypothetical protein
VNPAIRLGATVLCLAATAAAAYNVYGDNGEVEKAAESVACGEAGAVACRAQMTRMDRSPFWQTFEFATSKRAAGPLVVQNVTTLNVTVRCTRSAILVGDYACALRSRDQ